MAEVVDKLSPQQHKVIAAPLTSSSIAQAADDAGIGHRTLFRWLNDPTFSEAYRAARRESVQQAVARLQQLSGPAVIVLASIMADRAKPASSRVTAAKTILEYAIKAVELEEIEARLTALEAQYANKS